MKRTILLILLFFLLSGCKNSMKEARADAVRAQTRRANDRHQAAMAERAAMTETRLATKTYFLWSGGVGGAVLIMVLAGSVSYFVVGFSMAKVKQANLMLVPLNNQTKQYPLIISNGGRAYNPNTLAASDMDVIRLPHPDALRGSQGVQMIGAGGEPRYKSYREYEQTLLLK